MAIINLIKQSLWSNMTINAKESEPYFTILGYFLGISYLIFYIFNKEISSPEVYENIYLRIIITTLGWILVFYKHWPKILKSISPLYFYITIFISFPFFFSFMLLHNQNSVMWHVNGLVGLVFLAIFVDWVSFLILSLTGIGLSIILASDYITYNSTLLIACTSYVAPLLYLIIFSKGKKTILEERNKYINNIKTLNEGLEKKVQERTEELEKALSVKTEFLNNMSHEIRTPVHGFTALSEGLTESWDMLDEQKRYKYTKDISSNAKRLENLISSILDLSKFSADKMILEFKKVDFDKTIKNIIDECKGLYLSKKHIDIEYISNGEFIIISDQEKISQVLRNLFFNAIKFTPDGGHIKASFTETDSKCLHFTITDSGIGIPNNELEAIFEPFTQSSFTKTSAGGTGLGLGICQSIIKAHSGTIWANNNLQKGASFHFTIPTTRGNSTHSCDSHKDSCTTILMIDDEEICRTSMEILLIGTSYSLITTNGGAEGLKYLKQHSNSIDIVLLDLMMVDMHGLDFFQQMKNDPLLAKIPVILQSGTSNQSEINKAHNAGISSFLRKPYQKDDIISAIQKALQT